jgi:hypothetical protein
MNFQVTAMMRCRAIPFIVMALFAVSYAAWSPSGRHLSDDDSSAETRTPSFYQIATDINPATLTSTLVVAQADNGPQTEDIKIFVDRNLIGISSANSLTFADVPIGNHYIVFSFNDNFFIDKYFLYDGDSCYLSVTRASAGDRDSLTFGKISKDTGLALEASGAYAIRYAKYANGNILMNQKYYENLVDKFEHGIKFVGDTKGAPSPTQFNFRPRNPGAVK